MKERIKNVLNFKRLSRVVFVIAILIVVVLSVGLISSRVATLNLFRDMAGTYSLENPTEKQKFERLLSITLYKNGDATLRTPLISSYLLPKCTYSVDDDELLIHAAIENDLEKGFYGVKNKEVIARFKITGDETLVFRLSTVPLFAEFGAQYIKGL